MHLVMLADYINQVDAQNQHKDITNTICFGDTDTSRQCLLHPGMVIKQQAAASAGLLLDCLCYCNQHVQFELPHHRHVAFLLLMYGEHHHGLCMASIQC